MNKLMLIIDIWSVIQYYEKLWSSYDRKCSCWLMSINFDESMWMWLWEYDWCVSQKYFSKKAIEFFEYFMPSCKHFGLLIYMMSNPNQGFMLEGWFLEITLAKWLLEFLGIPRNKGENFHGKFRLGIPRNS